MPAHRNFNGCAVPRIGRDVICVLPGFGRNFLAVANPFGSIIYGGAQFPPRVQVARSAISDELAYAQGPGNKARRGWP